MKKLISMIFTGLVSFSVFAHDGQDGNGPILNISLAEYEACRIIAYDNSPKSSRPDMLVVSYLGETYYFSREELAPKCCAVGLKSCYLDD